jgi:CheY-like chemotaxis protein
LGLAISKELVNRMHGEIGVRSEPAKGSVFWFSAQLLLEPEQAPLAPGRFEGVRLLVAEAHRATREAVRLRVEEGGGIVEEVADAAGFLEWCGRRKGVSLERIFVLIAEEIRDALDGVARLQELAASGVRIALLSGFSRQGLSNAETQDGCSFLLTKPLRVGEVLRWMEGLPAERDAGRDSKVKADLESEAVMRPLRLMVAEDNKVNQSVIRHQLARLGHELVFLAENGVEVLEALGRIEVDALLLDCHMPEMDGYETVRAIRAMQGKGRYLRVIAMTANTMEGDREKCLAAGMDDYISKPLKERELVAAFGRVTPALGGAEVPPLIPRPPIDPAAMAALRELGGEDGQALVETLSEQFLAAGGSLLEELERAVAAADYESVRRCAHTLKGSAANFGAADLVEACAVAERVATESQLQALEAAVARVPQEFELVRVALLEACLRA